MSRFWNSKIKKQTPYIPGEQPQDKDLIKLNTNENPFSPSKNVLEQIKVELNEKLRLYPDPTAIVLKEAIAMEYFLEADQVFVGNGSDEILAFCFLAFFESKNEKNSKCRKSILFPDITYKFYKVYAEMFDIPYEIVNLKKDFTIDVDGFIKENGGIILANPNAQTGIEISLNKIEKILTNNPESLIIIDEAYVDFGGTSSVCLINKYPNILVVQTMSKSRNLAGLRVGYALGNKDLILGLEIVKNSFNSYTLDRLAIAGAKASISDREYFKTCINKIIKTREKTIAELRELNFNVTNSKANFIFISHEKISAEDLFLFLREEGIIVRYFKENRIDNFLRVTIGTDYEMKIFINSVKKYIEMVKL